VNSNNRRKFQFDQDGRQTPKRRELEGFWPDVALACAIKNPTVGFLGRFSLLLSFPAKRK
jgi:hypothetical protein